MTGLLRRLSPPRWCVAALTLVALLGWQAAPAAAESGKSAKRESTIRLKLIGTSYSPVYSDGARWVAYEPTAGVTRIMDTLRGKTTSRADPESCGGGLIAIGGGEMLYACSDPECPEATDACVTERVLDGPETGRWTVEDILSSVEHPLNTGAGLPAYVTQFGVPGQSDVVHTLAAVGSQWAATESGGSQRFFVNWHTGQVVKEVDEPSSASRDYENLNSRALLAPLCSPLARRLEYTGPKIENPRYGPLTYEPPFMAEDRLIESESRRRSFLHRCGSRSVRSLPEESSVLHGVLISRHERLSQLRPRSPQWLGQFYRIVGPFRRGFASALTLTATTVFTTLATREVPPLEPRAGNEGAPGERGPNLYNVWVGKLPWR